MTDPCKSMDNGGAAQRAPLLSRRRALFLLAVAPGVAFGGNLLFRWHKRQHFNSKLLKAAHADLESGWAQQVAELPGNAATRIKAVFDGACLNVHRFTDRVCTLAFAEKLRACGSEQAQRQLLDATFSEEILSPIQFDVEIQTILKDTGGRLDRDWREACRKLDLQFAQALAEDGRAWSSKLQAKLDPVILAEVSRARALSHALVVGPSLGKTALKIGTSAMQLLPMLRFGPKLMVPAFLVAALAPLWNAVWGWLAHQPKQYRAAISEHVSGLAIRVAGECEAAFHERISDLQKWQSLAIERVVADL